MRFRSISGSERVSAGCIPILYIVIIYFNVRCGRRAGESPAGGGSDRQQTPQAERIHTSSPQPALLKSIGLRKSERRSRCFWVSDGREIYLQFVRQTKKRRSERPSLVFAVRGWKMGLEPTTPGTTIQCSNRLSYIHHVIRFDPYRCAKII